MFAGLMSRWTTPARWAASKPRPICTAIASASLSSKDPSSSFFSRLRPSIKAIAMKVCPLTSSISWTVQMLGCSTAAAA